MASSQSSRSRATELPSAARTLTRLLANARLLGVERVGIAEAEERVLGEDLASSAPIPSRTHATRDGFALRSADLEGDGPWTIRRAGEARAGHPSAALDPRCAARISTGATLPEGADCVVAQEDVTRRQDTIVLASKPAPGQHVRAAGSDVAAGSKPLRCGARLTPGRIALAAALGRALLVVARRPVVTVVATGDELCAPGSELLRDRVRESTSFAVAAWMRRAGGVPRLLPPVADDRAATLDVLGRAVRSSDLVVTVGGVGPGDHDHVRPALQELGATIDVEGVAMSPGRPFSAGQVDDVRILCLPGNPTAAMLTCVLFAVPLVRALQGDASPVARRAPLRVVGSHVKRTRHEELLRALLEIHDDELCAVLLANQDSAAITGFAAAQALVFVEQGRKGIRHGERLPVMLLADV
jgi:molybdopterin molybdotransferase